MFGKESKHLYNTEIKAITKCLCFSIEQFILMLLYKTNFNNLLKLFKNRQQMCATLIIFAFGKSTAHSYVHQIFRCAGERTTHTGHLIRISHLSLYHSALVFITDYKSLSPESCMNMCPCPYLTGENSTGCHLSTRLHHLITSILILAQDIPFPVTGYFNIG